jgi:3-oxoacyl-[acyl-carrier-protein] synthase II
MEYLALLAIAMRIYTLKMADFNIMHFREVNMKKRVVITGLGVVSSLGMSVDKFWNAIKEGKSGISTLTKFDTTNISTKVAAEIKDFNPTDFIDKKEARRMDRFTQFALAAAKMAVENSGIDLDKLDKSRTGVIVGSGIGGIETIENQHEVITTKGPGRVSPFFTPMIISNMASARIAIQYGFMGFNECIVTACATSNNAIGDAFKVIQRGDADVIVAGGAEAAITPLSFAGFCSAGAMSVNPDPATACRPFDKDRDGFVMGEGAGILILEDYEHAVNRDAEIYAEIVGYGCTCDAYHITAPHPEGIGGIRCMNLAMEDAGITPDSIDYINTHGTSTPIGDAIEVTVIKASLGKYSKNTAIN